MDRKDIKAKMDDLAERAKKRCVAHSSTKPASDTSVENHIFKDLEAHVYKNIVVRSDCR